MDFSSLADSMSSSGSSSGLNLPMVSNMFYAPNATQNSTPILDSLSRDLLKAS